MEGGEALRLAQPIEEPDAELDIGGCKERQADIKRGKAEPQRLERHPWRLHQQVVHDLQGQGHRGHGGRVVVDRAQALSDSSQREAEPEDPAAEQRRAR